jgi:hypothetical protein
LAVEALPVEALPVEALPVEALPVEALPVEALPVEGLAAAVTLAEAAGAARTVSAANAPNKSESIKMPFENFISNLHTALRASRLPP